MCLSTPKQAKPAAPPPPVEKSVETLDLSEELGRKAMNSRKGINKLTIDRKL